MRGTRNGRMRRRDVRRSLHDTFIDIVEPVLAADTRVLDYEMPMLELVYRRIDWILAS